MYDSSIALRPKRNRTIVDSYQDPPDLEYVSANPVKKSKKDAHFAVPRVVHTIWLNKLSGGYIPSDRFANMLSFSKQFAAEGWKVKVWVNKPVIWHRACTGFGLDKSSPHRGVALETHAFSQTEPDYKKRSVRQIQVCEDRLLFPQMDSVNESSYNQRRDQYKLPRLTNLRKLFASGVDEKDRENTSGLYEAQPFRKSLLDYYRLQLVGRCNYASASDYLRTAALKEGGLYVDSDTKAAGVFDPGSRFRALYAPAGIIVPIGWDTGYGNDLMAVPPKSRPLEYLQLDQLYRAIRLEQLPYVVWAKETDGTGLWSKRSVKVTTSGLKITPRERGYCVRGLGNKELVSLSDTARWKGYFYTAVKGAQPAIQQGICREYWEGQIDENAGNLRFLLTLHGSGPWTLIRMDKSLGLHGSPQYLFENRSPDNPLKSIDLNKALSVTDWGGLTRMNTISWDSSGGHGSAANLSYDDGELGEVTLPPINKNT